MTRLETIAYAAELLKRAAIMEGEAWKALAHFSKEEEIEEAMDVAMDMSGSEARDTLANQDGFKACALMDWWNDQELYAREANADGTNE